MRAMRFPALILAACLLVTTPGPATAHLMVAQQGTIKLLGDGAFMVLSLPVSAFTGWDDDRDGRLSAAELNAHRQTFADQLDGRLQLLGAGGPRPLQGLMMSPSPDDDAPGSPASQLVVMGRFQLDSADDGAALRLRTDLFGVTEAERSFGITIMRGSDRALLTLTPQRPQAALLASGWQVVGDYFLLGIEHILGGWDHLLFLLLVLLFCRSWQSIVMTLSCFTVGHAITLSISLFGGITLSPAIVEPAIAITLIAMPAFDIIQQRRATSHRTATRLGLIFGCALIHGLGLASSLQDIGLDTTHRLQSLAGFNLGIEAAQIALAMAASAVIMSLRWAGSRRRPAAGGVARDRPARH